MTSGSRDWYDCWSTSRFVLQVQNNFAQKVMDEFMIELNSLVRCSVDTNTKSTPRHHHAQIANLQTTEMQKMKFILLLLCPAKNQYERLAPHTHFTSLKFSLMFFFAQNAILESVFFSSSSSSPFIWFWHFIWQFAVEWQMKGLASKFRLVLLYKCFSSIWIHWFNSWNYFLHSCDAFEVQTFHFALFRGYPSIVHSPCSIYQYLWLGKTALTLPLNRLNSPAANEKNVEFFIELTALIVQWCPWKLELYFLSTNWMKQTSLWINLLILFELCHAIQIYSNS